MTATAALSAIEHRWPDLGAAIGRVRPYHYREDRGDRQEIRVLFVWTENDARARLMLFDLAAEITATTGWYPMITGRFGWVFGGETNQRLKMSQRAPDMWPTELGPPGRLVDLTDQGRGAEEGVRFELVCEQGSLLLDVGTLPSPKLLEAADRANLIVISHSHRDHAGAQAIASVLERCEAPLLMSELTLSQLLSATAYFASAKTADRLAARSHVLTVGTPLSFRCGSRLEFHHANHSPGAVMTVLTTPSEKAFLYTGDFSITNAYSDSVLQSIRGAGPAPFPQVIDLALIDATMLAAKDESEPTDSYFDDVVRRAMAAGQHLLVLVDTADIGVRLYLELYRLVLQGARRQTDVRTYLDWQISELISTLSRIFSRAATDKGAAAGMDDVLTKLWQSRKNAFESQHLFAIDNKAKDNFGFHGLRRQRVVVIATCEKGPDLFADPNLSSALAMLSGQQLDVLVVGPVVDWLPGRIAITEGRLPGLGPINGRVTALRHLLWRIHSAPEDLVAWLEGDYKQTLREVRLFHAYPSKIKRGLTLAGFSDQSAKPVAIEENVSTLLG
jgi:glyoxylase-like metal-dependent hydrolase (beta-lactamase superfamily II)